MGRLGAACAVMGRRGRPRGALGRACRTTTGSRRAAGSGRRRWASGAGLDASARDWRPDAVVPLDDMAAGVLRDLALRPARRRRARPARALARRPAPLPHRLLAGAADRGRGGRSASARRPSARRRPREAAARRAALGFPLMVKREGTCGGSGVALVRDAAGLARPSARPTAGRGPSARCAGSLGFRPDRGGGRPSRSRPTSPARWRCAPWPASGAGCSTASASRPSASTRPSPAPARWCGRSTIPRWRTRRAASSRRWACRASRPSTSSCRRTARPTSSR